MAVARRDKGQNPGTQTTFTPEGAVADGQMSIEVDVVLTGAPASVQSDYATLLTNVGALSTSKTINWKKR